MFSGLYSRYGGFGGFSRRYGESDSDEEEKSQQFRLKESQHMQNAALEKALEEDGSEENENKSDGIIRLETDVGDDGMDLESAIRSYQSHLCVECQDQPAVWICHQCGDDQYCEVCWKAMHKRGTRSKHETSEYQAGVELNRSVTAPNASDAAATSHSPTNNDQMTDSTMDESDSASVAPDTASSATNTDTATATAASSSSSSNSDAISDDQLEQAYQRSRPTTGTAFSSKLSDDDLSVDSHDDSSDDDDAADSNGGIVLPSRSMGSSLLTGSSMPADFFVERAKYIPMRLTLEERKYLRLLEATLNVSEYTDKIDIISNKDKMMRIKEQLRDLCSILSGLVVANDYKKGQQLLKDKEFAENAEFFQSIFELGRRHKIRNPEKMRNTYGKLVFILQDSIDPRIEELMGFHLVAPLKTAYSTLETGGALALLRDPRMMIATGDIKTEGRQRPEIERDIKTKNDTVTFLARKYQTSTMDEEAVRACILSIADNHTFLLQNRFCCDTMLEWLTDLYHPTEPEQPWSLAILGGRSGARLTHSHADQYLYVLQSLTLWRSILHDFFELWVKSEQDLMDPQSPYRLRNTGQGLNRQQAAPRVGKAIHNILYHCQKKLGRWVGSSVVHLGDHNVPNSLIFIDKYSQGETSNIREATTQTSHKLIEYILIPSFFSHLLCSNLFLSSSESHLESDRVDDQGDSSFMC